MRAPGSLGVAGRGLLPYSPLKGGILDVLSGRDRLLGRLLFGNDWADGAEFDPVSTARLCHGDVGDKLPADDGLGRVIVSLYEPLAQNSFIHLPRLCALGYFPSVFVSVGVVWKGYAVVLAADDLEPEHLLDAE